jgi:type II secretory pathway component GspD/PulD (secretin)
MKPRQPHSRFLIPATISSVFLIAPLFFFTSPIDLFGADAQTKLQSTPTAKANFVLTVKDNLISLKAKDASLKEILEEIGRRMKIDVVAAVPENEEVTVDFEKLTLEEAVNRLSTNYSYQIDSEKTGKRITRIVVLDKRKIETGASKPTPAMEQKAVKAESKLPEAVTKQPEPFKFVIGDPEPEKKRR